MKASKLKLLRSIQVTSRPSDSTRTQDRALAIIQHAGVGPSISRGVGQEGATQDPLSSAVHFARGVPIHLLPNREAQPWELLPLKAAAFKMYPNMFNSSCMFFGSLQRDVAQQRPAVLLRPTRLGIDLAKMMRNLGIIGSWEVWQRPHIVGGAKRWPAGAEPEDELFLRLFPQCYLKLHLRWDQHRPLWLPPDMPVTQQALHTNEALPLSTTNISKASRPVLMTPQQLAAAVQKAASGIFVCFHHTLGLITDATVQHHDLSAVLVLAHVGLPLSQATQIRGALRLKHLAELAAGVRPVPLSRWNMLDQLQDSVSARARRLAASGAAEKQARKIVHSLKERANQDARLISVSEEVSETLNDELTAWLLRDRLPELYEQQEQEKTKEQGQEKRTGNYEAQHLPRGMGGGGDGFSGRGSDDGSGQGWQSSSPWGASRAPAGGGGEQQGWEGGRGDWLPQRPTSGTPDRRSSGRPTNRPGS